MNSQKQSFIYNFLLAPQYKILRYLTLIVFFVIISVNQALVGYTNIMPLLGNKVYAIVIGTILVYIVVVYLTIQIILKYLLAGRYTLFILCIVICAVIFTIIPNIVYGIYIENYDFFSIATWADILSAFVIYLLCIPGVIVPIFLRNWMVSRQQLNQLKKKQRLSQVEQLKEQINPTSFFKILNRSGTLVKKEPEKASALLMKLSQLLRYQLYDSNRNQVLLTSEISFLQNFLELEKLYSSTLEYTITISDGIKATFISPSILLPFVQAIISTLDDRYETQNININIDNDKNDIFFTISTGEIDDIVLLEKELSKVKERLEALYNDNYLLTIHRHKLENKTEVCLRLYREKYAK